jgi:signal transduction histidine kinase
MRRSTRTNCFANKAHIDVSCRLFQTGSKTSRNRSDSRRNTISNGADSKLSGTDQSGRLIGALLEISNLVGSVMLLEDILARIVRIAADLMDAPICSVYLLQEDGSLLVRSNVGSEEETRGHVTLGWGKGIPGWVARNGQLIALPDATLDPRYNAMLSPFELGCRAYICAPLRIQEEIIGVMTVRKREEYTFSAQECMLFETVCKQVAIVLEKSRMYSQKLKADQLAAVAVSMSGIAHYIKNVLFTSQIGERQVELGLQEGGDIRRAREGWKSLHEATGKIRKLVESMLNYCRSTQPELKPVNLNQMVDDIVRNVRDQADHRHVRIKVELDHDLDRIKLEPDSMYDALLNLVTNGIDAITEKSDGQLVIRTERLPGQSSFKIEVIDNGAGIPEDIRGKVFNLFFSTKGQKGTGIGLSATRKVIEDHGGTIKFDSTVGQGTKFTVYLPLWRPDDK